MSRFDETNTGGPGMKTLLHNTLAYRLEELRQLKPLWATADHYIVSHDRPQIRTCVPINRVERAVRVLRVWLRERGLNQKHPIHELRKLFGAHAATQQGLFAAQKYLDHASPMLTAKVYAALMNSLPVNIYSPAQPSSFNNGTSKASLMSA